MDELKPDLTVELPNDTQKTESRDYKPEEFYGQGDSVYIKVTFSSETEAFKFDVKNELIEQNYTEHEIIPQNIASLSAFIRGMLEFAVSYPHQMYNLGIRAISTDLISNMNDLTDEQKKLLLGDVEGSA